MATTDDELELVVCHSADEFERYDNLDVDEEIENGGINDGESDGDDGDGESDDDGGGDSDKGRDGDSRSECDGDGDGDVNSGDDDDDDAMESLSRSTPAPQQPCPYRLTTRLKRQYTLLNVPPAPPTPPAARVVNMLRAGVAIKDIQEAYQSQMVHLLLSLMRSLHLYEKVREYIRDPKKRDKKHLEMFQTVTNQSSNAIPDPSAVEGHESADNTHSEMQDEGNSCVSGRRKRRFRPQTLGPATMAPYPSPTQYNYQLLTAVGITRPTTCETINSLPVKPITPTLQEDLHCQGNHQLLVELPARTGQMGTHP
eukprot:Em0034g33a